MLERGLISGERGLFQRSFVQTLVAFGFYNQLVSEFCLRGSASFGFGLCLELAAELRRR